MTGGEFFPRDPHNQGRGEQDSLFPAGPVIKCIVNSKLGKRRSFSTSRLTQVCRGFKEHELITYESKVQVVHPGR